MKLYTCNFAGVKRLNAVGIMPIGIAQYPPKWFTGESYKVLAPHGWMLSLNKDEYVRKFNGILFKLDQHKVVKEIEALSGGKDVALLCFEKLGDFCHRHMVSAWLRQANYTIEEYVLPREEPAQKDLFA